MQVTCEALTTLDFDLQPILPHPFLQKLSIYLVDCCSLVQVDVNFIGKKEPGVAQG